MSILATTKSLQSAIESCSKITRREDLQERFDQNIACIAEKILENAALIRRADEMGWAIRGNRLLITSLRKVAYGQVCPGVVVSYFGNSYLLKKASALPMPEQERIADDGKTIAVRTRCGRIGYCGDQVRVW